MHLNGTFEGFDFAHLLQMLATTGKNGRLRLKCEGTEGLVLLRDGKIICAVSTSVRESLGSILLSRGWLTPDQLEEGLAAQGMPVRRIDGDCQHLHKDFVSVRRGPLDLGHPKRLRRPVVLPDERLHDCLSARALPLVHS